MAKKVKENNEVSTVRRSKHGGVLTVFFSLLTIFYLYPIFLVLINSFKKKGFITKNAFALPDERSFTGLSNFIRGIEKTNFFQAFGYSVLITVGSVAVIILCTSMCAWYITRVHNKVNATIYMLCLFSMIVPFQMVMFTLSKLANMMHLSNPVGIILVYLGFGAGLAVFMFCGFVKSIPIEIEEAAMIDGCTPIQTFFQVVFPIMKPTAITVANFTGNVDLERLFTSLSGIGYQKIQDDSNRHSVLKRWLWSSRLGYDDGNACTCNCSNCSFLCGLSEIYY